MIKLYLFVAEHYFTNHQQKKHVSSISSQSYYHQHSHHHQPLATDRNRSQNKRLPSYPEAARMAKELAGQQSSAGPLAFTTTGLMDYYQQCDHHDGRYSKKRHSIEKYLPGKHSSFFSNLKRMLQGESGNEMLSRMIYQW